MKVVLFLLFLPLEANFSLFTGTPGRVKRDTTRRSTRPAREETTVRRGKPTSDLTKKVTPTNNNAVSREGKGEKKAETAAPPSRPPIEMNAMTFPPLHGVEEDTPVPTLGYKDSYQKYNFDQIITIVKNVKEATLPSDLDPSNHPIALSNAPNMDLLKRQRTFSIDETREQLRQGRPVQREAIISGAVDYRSLMFGDESELGHKKRSSEAPPSSSGAVSQSHNHDAVLAKAMDQSLSFEETDHKQQVNNETQVQYHHQQQAVPLSPQRISASTWAAMVKSSSEATTSGSIMTPSQKSASSRPSENTSSKVTPPPKNSASDKATDKTEKHSRPKGDKNLGEKSHDNKVGEQRRHNRSERKSKSSRENNDDQSKSSNKVENVSEEKQRQFIMIWSDDHLLLC
jgi:hypothetical protein